MEKDDVISLAHLLSAMKDSAIKLEEAVKKKDAEKIAGIKREILRFQKDIERAI